MVKQSSGVLVDELGFSGENGKILLESQGSMLLGGAVSTSGDLTLSSKAQIYDGENFGARNLVDGSANPQLFCAL